jgi:sulfur carrier protein
MDENIKTPDTMITVIANGQLRAVQAGSTLANFLCELAIMPAHVVVQMDGVIVARGEFEHVVLQEGNKLEIVTLVGGG